MIMPADSSSPPSDSEAMNHTLSPGFLNAMRLAAVMQSQGQDGWEDLVKHAAAEEFPNDEDTRAFAEANFCSIVGYLAEDRAEIQIRSGPDGDLVLYAAEA